MYAQSLRLQFHSHLFTAHTHTLSRRQPNVVVYDLGFVCQKDI